MDIFVVSKIRIMMTFLNRALNTLKVTDFKYHRLTEALVSLSPHRLEHRWKTLLFLF